MKKKKNRITISRNSFKIFSKNRKNRSKINTLKSHIHGHSLSFNKQINSCGFKLDKLIHFYCKCCHLIFFF